MVRGQRRIITASNIELKFGRLTDRCHSWVEWSESRRGVGSIVCVDSWGRCRCNVISQRESWRVRPCHIVIHWYQTWEYIVVY